jgi:ubiquinone biosynthesis protein Coq4
MGFRYIQNLVTPDKVDQFLELVDLAAGAGKDVNNVFDLSDKLRDSRPMQLCIKAIQSDPACAAILEERYVGAPYDLAAMLKMPKGSLGWTYAKVMTTLGYDPQFYRTPESLEQEDDYINFRVYKTHDIHHIITGYSMDDFGEFGVISVMAGQIRFPTFIFLDLIGMLMAFLRSEQLYSEDLEPAKQLKTLGYVFNLSSAGVAMGQAAKPLFPVKWEEGLERPLEEWRQELNIKPVVEGPYSWYSRPQLQAAIA